MTRRWQGDRGKLEDSDSTIKLREHSEYQVKRWWLPAVAKEEETAPIARLAGLGVQDQEREIG